MSICLTMIVKNEAHSLPRCLASLKAHLGYYVLCDTGSEDDTPAIARQALEGVPGEIHRDAWVGFAHNRNLGLERCRGHGDWILTIDADEVLLGDGPLNLDPQVDAYLGLSKRGSFQYWRRRLVRNDGNWRYLGVIHEYLAPLREPVCEERLNDFIFGDYGDGCRTRSGHKFLSDALLLERDLLRNPNDARNVFYLAESYRNMGWRQKALECYRRRATMGGWEEEVYYSLYQATRMRHDLESNIFLCVEDFVRAWQTRPCRLEALVYLCTALRDKQAFGLVYELAANKSRPNQDVLFVDADSEWRIIEEHALAAYYRGRHPEAAAEFRSILERFTLDGSSRERIVRNLAFSEPVRPLAASA